MCSSESSLSWALMGLGLKKSEDEGEEKQTRLLHVATAAHASLLAVSRIRALPTHACTSKPPCSTDSADSALLTLCRSDRSTTSDRSATTFF